MPVEGMEKLLQCGKCRQQYDLSAKRPKLLVCHHCFCMQCIQSFIKSRSNQTAVCPTCAKITCVGRNGVAGLPDNEYLLPQVKFHLNPSKKMQQQPHVSPQESDLFVSDESEASEFESDEEDEDKGLDQACGGDTLYNGMLEALSNHSLSSEVRIYCQTCMSLASASCLSSHRICNYEQGVTDLKSRLEDAVQSAGQNLVSEVHLLEENSRLMGRVQSAWSGLGQMIDQTTISQTLALSSARSLLDNLPDPKLGAQSAKAGDPSTLSRAVLETENIMRNSAARLAQTQSTANIWKAISNCNVNMKSGMPLANKTEVFALEFNERTKEDIICLMYALSKLMEARMTSAPEKKNLPAIEAKVKANDSVTVNGSEWVHVKNGNVADPELPTFDMVSRSNKRMPKVMSSGCAYCFFDLMQGHAELGRIIMEVNCKAAPKMAKNFIELCTGAHGFGYLNTKLWRISSGDHVDGGDIPEGGQCSIFDQKPFLGDASNLQDGIGMLRMRGRGTSEDGQPIVGAQFMIWIKERKFKNYSRTLVFGRVSEGLDILTNMPETRQRKGKPFVSPVTILRCGIME